MDFDTKTGHKPDPPVLPLENHGGLGLRVRLMLPVLLALIPAFLMLLGDTLEDRASFTQRARWRSFGFLNTLSSEIGQNVRSLRPWPIWPPGLRRPEAWQSMTVRGTPWPQPLPLRGPRGLPSS